MGLSVFLQSCCAPNACRYAKSGSAELEKSLAEIEKYKERNGKYPVTLDDIQKGFAAATEQGLRAACPECGNLEYQTDAYGYELRYRYSHMGPNWCLYTTDTQKWNCRGNY
jgi:hypothetical protein